MIIISNSMSTPKKRQSRTRSRSKVQKNLNKETITQGWKGSNPGSRFSSNSVWGDKEGVSAIHTLPKKKKTNKHSPYIIKDTYFFEAKRLGYRARSAFKLLELQEQFNIIHPGMTVLDIASAPGSWLQVLAKTVGPSWRVVGIDIAKVKALGYPNVHIFQGNVLEVGPIVEFLKWLDISRVDCITSDIAPNTTGQTGVDQYRSVELNLAILDIADMFLRKWGTLILKVFVGEDVNDLIGPIKRRYKVLRRAKPKACRDRSFEEYFVCEGKND